MTHHEHDENEVCMHTLATQLNEVCTLLSSIGSMIWVMMPDEKKQEYKTKNGGQ